MRKRIAAFLMAGSIAAFGQSIPTTPNLGLQLIPDGYQNWGVPYRTTMTTIDNWSATVARFPGPNGIVFNTSTTTSRVATAADVVALWTSCSSGYLMFNGTCATPAGGVTTVFGRSGDVVAVTGDYTFSQIGGTIASGQIPATIAANTTGNAASATQLLVVPTQCTGGTPVATGIQANGNANCTTGGGGGISGMTAGQVPIAASATTITSSKALAGAGTGITTGPTSSTTGDIAVFTGTAGQISDGAVAASSLVTLTGTLTLTNKSLTSPALTGTPTAPTATVGTNTTQVATTAFVLANAGGGSGNTTSTALTTNTIPKANGANSIINSALTDDGTSLTYSGSGGAGASSVSAGVFIGTGTTPAIAAGAGAGTSPTVSLDANAHNSSGAITIVLGTDLPDGGTLAALTFSTAFSTIPHCVISAGSADAASNTGVVFNTQNTTTATLMASGTPIGTTLVYTYICQQ